MIFLSTMTVIQRVATSLIVSSAVHVESRSTREPKQTREVWTRSKLMDATSSYSPIKSETEATRKAGNVILKEGIFDKIPEPEMEGFALARQPWVKRVDGCSQFITSFGTAKLE